MECANDVGGSTSRKDLQWEHIFRDNGYIPALTEVNNKYYVSNEHMDLVGELMPRWYLFQIYDCFRAIHPASTCKNQPEGVYYY